MGPTLQVLIFVPVIVVFAAVVFGVLYWRRHSQDRRQNIILLTTAGTIERIDPKRDLNTARSDERHESYFCDMDAYRRRASGSHEMVQFCHQSSAVPAFPGEPDSFRHERLKYYKGELTNIAVAWADRDTEDIPRLENQAQQHQLMKIAIMGTIVIVLVISLLVLFTSGNVSWPF